MATLYGEQRLDSPFVFTAFVALGEKRVPFGFERFDLSAGPQRQPRYVELSLTARVPTLELDGFALSESLAIVEYLEERLPPPAHPPLLPPSLEARARARQLLGWLRTDIHALRQARPSSSIFYRESVPPLADAALADRDKLVRIASTLLGGRATLFETWSIADADLAFALQRLLRNGDRLPPALRDYAEAQWQRPSIFAWVKLERPGEAR